MSSLSATRHNVPYYPLKVRGALEDLTAKQRLYAHYLMMAGWCGTSVVARQLSKESLRLLRALHRVLAAKQTVEVFKRDTIAALHLAEEEVQRFLQYAALVSANMGNYLSFGDSKFVPSCREVTFESTIGDTALTHAVYDLTEGTTVLGHPPRGVSAYYSDTITEEEAVLANEFLAAKRMEGVNTRVWRTIEEDGGVTLTVRVASAVERETPTEIFKSRRLRLSFGDHKDEMARVVGHLRQARALAENSTQERMLDHYIAHFTSGDVEAHKQSQREWVRDRAPAVECNIGFIESYRDPSGVRAEWEGFVAVVNHAQSRQYAALVSKAEQFIAKLPWGRDFEKDTFRSPSFTSLEVLGLASSGIPIGINIPNYDDVRQQDGFKNVFLANVG